TSNHVIESFSRNLMLLLNDWQESGFAAVSKAYCERLSRENGKNWHIDDNGDLISLNADRQMERKALLPRLAKPAWLDVLGGDLCSCCAPSASTGRTRSCSIDLPNPANGQSRGRSPSGAKIPQNSKERPAWRFAAVFSAWNRWDGRPWYRSSKRAKTI